MNEAVEKFQTSNTTRVQIWIETVYKVLDDGTSKAANMICNPLKGNIIDKCGGIDVNALQNRSSCF